jgi:hypothetical protein
LLGALIATPECSTFIYASLAAAKFLVAFLARAVAIPQLQGGLESTAEVALVVFKTSAIGGVSFLLYVAKAEPPHFSRPIDGFGACGLQSATNSVALVASPTRP